MNIVRDVFQILHVSLNKKFSKESKVRVRGIVDLNESPRVLTTTNFAAINLKSDQFIRKVGWF